MKHKAQYCIHSEYWILAFELLGLLDIFPRTVGTESLSTGLSLSESCK